jgi:hypothetical protein
VPAGQRGIGERAGHALHGGRANPCQHKPPYGLHS